MTDQHHKEEVWRTVPGFERYEVSDQGRVRNKETDKLLNPSTDSYGYLKLKLYNPQGVKQFKVHRLVLLVFKGPSELHTDHINMDKQDNRILNIEYVTNRENCFRRATLKDNGKGLVGVDERENGRYRARTWENGVYLSLGTFDTFEEAHQVYLDKRKELTQETPCTPY